MLINTRMHHTRSLQATSPHGHMEWRQRGSKRETRLAAREQARDAEMMLELWWLQHIHFYPQPRCRHMQSKQRIWSISWDRNPLCAAHVNCAHHLGLLASQTQPPAMDKVISKQQIPAPVLTQKQPKPSFEEAESKCLGFNS